MTRQESPAARMMRRIRAQLHADSGADPAARSISASQAPSPHPVQGMVDVQLPPYAQFSLQPTFVPSPDHHYRLADLLLYYDQEFVRVAYMAVLHRGPDEPGMQHFLTKLRGGVSKVDILKEMRYSREGRAIDVHIDGLVFRSLTDTISQIPLVGRVFKFALALRNLPIALQIQRAEQNHFFNLLTHWQHYQAANHDITRGALLSLNHNIHVLASSHAGVAGSMGSLGARQQAQDSKIAALDTSLQTKAGRRELAEQAGRLIELIDSRASKGDVRTTADELVRLIEERARKVDLDQLARGLGEAIGTRTERLQVMIEERAPKADLDQLARDLDEAIVVRADQLQLMIEDRPQKAEIRAMASELMLLIQQRLLKSEFDAISTDLLNRAETRAETLLRESAVVAQVAQLAAWAAAIREQLAETHRDKMKADEHMGSLLAEFRTARAAMVEEAESKLNIALRAAGVCAQDANDPKYDGLYARFEDQFRGSRDDIKQRQRVYLPFIERAGVGNADAPIVDLGCGRGEWLEVLRDGGFVARGVDKNSGFLDYCTGIKLDVVAGDCLDYLRSLKAESVGAVTMFHLIEHLPFDSMIAILDESYRVLKPCGIFIFETPNPSNLVVAACNFYVDPTHRKPLPSELGKFLVEARGFTEASVLPLHPVPAEWVQGATDHITLTMNHFFYGPQDYAVVCYKAARLLEVANG